MKPTSALPSCRTVAAFSSKVPLVRVKLGEMDARFGLAKAAQVALGSKVKRCPPVAFSPESHYMPETPKAVPNSTTERVPLALISQL